MCLLSTLAVGDNCLKTESASNKYFMQTVGTKVGFLLVIFIDNRERYK